MERIKEIARKTIVLLRLNPYHPDTKHYYCTICNARAFGIAVTQNGEYALCFRHFSEVEEYIKT